MRTATLVLALVAVCVQADMYFHNVRGSNNRLDEARRDRNNANRLFDSQNNNRGGYNVGSLYYYTGSILSLEWTNQHSCSDQNNHCEQIVQYMCDDLARDGTTTSTIPDNPANCEDFDCNNDIEYGMHESYDYYLDCKLRYRNMGLFIADRNLRGNTARYTRQNENGNRRGYECPEERDYYPYWHPTPWRDVVVFTNDATRCPYYKRESQNVKSRFACVLPPGFLNTDNIRRNRPIIPNTREECEDIMTETGNATWTEFLSDSRLSAPECVETHSSRDNHLGNSNGGFPINYNWTIPDIPHDHCVLRIRYNISTGEYDGWDGGIDSSVEQQSNVLVLDGATTNGNPTRRRKTISSLSSVYTQFDFEFEDAVERGYVFRQNPVVKVFPDVDATSNNFGLQLAINTNQFGRTFQDRSHTFAIRERPDDLQGETIYNLNVRGKRGNIVQVYPGVEYDFVPNRLTIAVDDYLHIQWTGSNTNPNNNDGQGRAGTDRSNIILLRDSNYDEGNGMAGPAIGHWGNSYPAHLDAYVNASFLGLSREDVQNLATLENFQYGGEMSELDDAGTYYDLGPRKITRAGTYYYMCTRNNNFTNRSQKGKVIVQENSMSQKRIGWPGGRVELKGNALDFPQGTLNGASDITMEEFSDAASAEEMLGISEPSGETVSSYVFVHPPTRFPNANQNGGAATISMPIDTSVSSDKIRISRANAASDWDFVELDTRVEDDMAYADTSQGGIFVANAELNAGLVAGVVVAAFVLLVIGLAVGGLVIYFLVRRDKWQKTKKNAYKIKMKVTRSFAKQV